MESFVYADSPLADLLEGEGMADPSADQVKIQEDVCASPDKSQFAPRGLTTLQTRFKSKLPVPLKLTRQKSGPITRIHNACSEAVNSRLGRADNERFLEHFRYIIVASGLLNEQPIPNKASNIVSSPNSMAPMEQFKAVQSDVNGVLLTGAAAFIIVWLIDWARRGRNDGYQTGRVSVVTTAFTAIALVTYAYVRRQWLKYLRRQAVDAASALVTNLQAFHASMTSSLSFIQEVELISRGYRLSSPLPPISRLEEKSQNRRCSRLRQISKSAYEKTIPILADQCLLLRQLVDENEVEKYMDIYEITRSDFEEACSGINATAEEGLDSPGSLQDLRVSHYRINVLRRVLLCTLLTMKADGGKPDFRRWKDAVDIMESVACETGEWAEKMNSILTEEEQFTLPSPVRATNPNPAKEKFRSQLRKLNSLSQGIRGLQARMQILREESNKSLEDNDDLADLSTSIMAQYETIGAELRSLMQTWENGKVALALNIDRHERRVSLNSNGLRSPALSLGGLTVVEEGGPADALRALNGELTPTSASPSISANCSDEEVYEAIALPRQRFSIKERAAKSQDDRKRQSLMREQRETSNNMLKELESVIHLRPKRLQTGRITSV